MRKTKKAETHPPWRKDRRPRLDASVYGHSGYAVHLTLCTAEDRPIFANNPDLAAIVTRTLEEAAAEKGVELYCYCLMPDHLHLVAAVRPGGLNLIDFIWVFKTKTTWATKGKAPAPLWQRSFYDRVVRRSEDLQQVCLYVVNNPVRKGLAAHWHEYPFGWVCKEV